MPAGKHKGKRVVLTIDQAAYEQWKAHAEALGLPVATLLRQIIEMSEPTAGLVFERLRQFKGEGMPIAEVLGPVLVHSLLALAEEEKKLND